MQRFSVQGVYCTTKNMRYPPKTRLKLLLLDMNKKKALISLFKVGIRIPCKFALFSGREIPCEQLVSPTPNKRATSRSNSLFQGEKRPGSETGSLLLVQCVLQRRTGPSARSALPVKLMAAKTFLSTNWK